MTVVPFSHGRYNALRAGDLVQVLRPRDKSHQMRVCSLANLPDLIVHRSAGVARPDRNAGRRYAHSDLGTRMRVGADGWELVNGGNSVPLISDGPIGGSGTVRRRGAGRQRRTDHEASQYHLPTHARTLLLADAATAGRCSAEMPFPTFDLAPHPA
jgi:hypothetical protein